MGRSRAAMAFALAIALPPFTSILMNEIRRQPPALPEIVSLPLATQTSPAASAVCADDRVAEITQPARQPLVALPDRIPCAISDAQDAQIPDRVRLAGWLGSRIAANEANRLAIMDTARLLEGYRARPGRQAWDGEHVGKWLHAASLAWANTGDPLLRSKLDETVSELCACQLSDGYLGTYLDKDRWTEWDVWAHKYNLIGLLTYIRLTGNSAPLSTCRRMADLLCDTFGDAQTQSLGKRDILLAGEHVGMAPTSVLEPMVLLYRVTGEPRYLEFCKYIVRAWEQPNGPHIISRLLQGSGVHQVGNAKAYEMLSCLNGLAELYRTTGERRYLEVILNAWSDIVAHRLYITGAASYYELFHADGDLPNVSNVGETCVTVTWLQLNAQLLRITGESRFAEQIEHVALNQLLGAQRPDGAAWGYYVQMEGCKPYSSTLDGHCCLSSGPRGIALLPTLAVTTDADGVVVNLYESGYASLQLRDGSWVSLDVRTMYPAEGDVTVFVRDCPSSEFAIKLRAPDWCEGFSTQPESTVGADGYRLIRRVWRSGDALKVTIPFRPRLVQGDHLNMGKSALMFGPLVLAADESLLQDPEVGLKRLALAAADLGALGVSPAPARASHRSWPGAREFRVNCSVVGREQPTVAVFVPFADAGMSGARYRVWVRVEGELPFNVLLDGAESRSRVGNVDGSINDDDPQSFVVTYTDAPAAEDWFGVTLDKPVSARSFVFTHGRNFHDGGWFDTSSAKPRVEVKRTPEATWETIGELADYPNTTASGSGAAHLPRNGEAFTLRLPTPQSFVAVRVVGTPSSGDRPGQAFVSCAELQAFAE